MAGVPVTLAKAVQRMVRARRHEELQRGVRGSRDRTLPGKSRVKARKAAQRAEREQAGD